MKLTYAVYFPSCQSMFRGLNSEQAWRIKILFYPRPSIVHIRKIISLLFSYRIQPHRHFDSMVFFIKIYPHPQIPPPTQTPHPHNPLIQHIPNHPKPDLFNTVITGIVLYWQQTETTIDTESQVCCVNQTYDSPITQGIDAGKRRICCGNTPHIQQDKCKSRRSNSNNIVLTLWYR